MPPIERDVFSTDPPADAGVHPRNGWPLYRCHSEVKSPAEEQGQPLGNAPLRTMLADASRVVPERIARSTLAELHSVEQPQSSSSTLEQPFQEGGDAPTSHSKITVAFCNIAELTVKRPQGRSLATVLAEITPTIIGFCEAPIANGAIGVLKDKDDGIAPLVRQLEKELSLPLTQRIVPVHAAFEAPETADYSGLASATRWPVTDSIFHQLESPPLAEEGETYNKGVLRFTIDVSGRKLTICVLHLAAAYRFGKRLGDPMFKKMHQQDLASAIRDADLIMGDFNTKDEDLSALQAGLERFVPVTLGEATYGSWKRQSDWILYNPDTFSGIARRWLQWSTSDHAVVGAELILESASPSVRS